MKICELKKADLNALVELQPVNWPDIRPNFEFHIRSPFCDPIKIEEGQKVVGVGTTIKHQDTAWLAMIIVHPDFRNQGIGKSITGALVDSLDESIYKTIYLDATDLGYPVYLKSGFRVENEYTHFDAKKISLEPVSHPSIISFEEDYRQSIYQLDRQISGEGRESILDLTIKTSRIFISAGKLQGVYFPDLFDGMIIAEDPEAGIELMKLRLQTKQFASAPSSNKMAIEYLANNNATPVRTSRRMIRGEERQWKPVGLYNRISGALG